MDNWPKNNSEEGQINTAEIKWGFEKTPESTQML